MAYFYKDPWQQILDELNTKNAETLVKDLTRDNVEPVGSIVLADTATGASSISIAAIADAGFVGWINNPSVTYKRYVGSKLFPVTPRVDVSQGEKYSVVVQRLAERYNLPPFVLEGDYSDLTLLDSQVLPNGDWESTKVSLTFNDNSVGYTGTLEFLAFNRSNDLQYIITNRDLDVLVYPDTADGSKGSLSILSYPVNYTIDYRTWGKLSEGDPITSDQLDELVSEISGYYKLASGEKTKLQDELKISLAGAVVKSIDITTDVSSGSVTDITAELTAVVSEGSWAGTVYIQKSTNASSPV